MDLKDIVDGIKKTGFKLEFDIAQTLSKNGWNVITNKYYVDDLQETVREIDLVTYKATKVNHFYIYTVLIISCKKNEKDSWALLSKKPNPLDPNAEWLPVHAWSNDKALDYMIKDKGWKHNYLGNNKSHGSNILSKVPDNHIFAFQEMNKDTGKPNNDKNIFNSVTSLMKAQAYEMNALPERKKDPSIFQFNLISIMETDLVRVDFTESKIEAEDIEEETYVADYIIDKKQTSAKVHFIKHSSFEKQLKRYNSLHDANVLSFNLDYKMFYSDAAQVSNKRNIFLDEIKRDMYWKINSSLRRAGNESIDKSDISLYWVEKENVLDVDVSISNDAIEKLNNDKSLIKDLKTSLKTHLQYEGECRFAEDTPF